MAKKRKKKYKGPLKAPKAAGQETADGVESRAEEPAPTETDSAAAEPTEPAAIAPIPTSFPPVWVALLLLVVASLAAHVLCLWNPFYLDDQAHILKNQQIHKVDYYGSWGYRTLTYFCWITIHQNLGFNSLAFHALNLVIHTLTVLSFYFAAREFVRISQFRPSLEKSSHFASIPFWGAALFAVHPIGTEPVNYASQTSILLVTLFTTIATFAMLRWINSRRWWWILGIIAFTGLSAFSKKPGFAHSFSNLAIIAVVLWKSLPLLRMQRSPLRKGIVIGLVAVFFTASLVYMKYWGTFYYIHRIFSDPESPWHILTQGRVFWAYLSRLFIPTGLCSDHWIPITKSYADGEAWMGLAGIVILVLFSLALYWRKRAYCLLMLLALDPILLRFLFRNNEPMVEYRLYPALPWFSLLVVFFIAVTLLPKTSPRVFNAGIAILVAVFAGMSTMRSVTWNSPYSLADNIIEQYPLHARCHSYIQAVDFSGGGKSKNLMSEVANPAIIANPNLNKEESHHAVLEGLLGDTKDSYQPALENLKKAEAALGSAKNDEETAKLKQARDLEYRKALAALRYRIAVEWLNEERVGDYEKILREQKRAEKQFTQLEKKLLRIKDPTERRIAKMERDAAKRKAAAKKNEVEVIQQLNQAVQVLDQVERNLVAAKDPAEKGRLSQEREAAHKKVLELLKKKVDSQYQKVIDRQILVRQVMKEIFAVNRKNKERNYIIARALNSFMFCEQYNGYALIALGKPQDAINRVTEVIETLKKAVKNDQSMSFAVLYRVRGQANATLGKHQLAAEDFRRCLERFPTDLETPRLIERLPKQFQALAYPPGYQK